MKSQALLVRDEILKRVKKLPFFKDFSFASTKAFVVQADNLPHCGVYFISELRLPDGDANAGDVRFRVSVRIGFSVIVVNNDDEEGELMADEAFSAIASLFLDTTLMGFDAKFIQGVTRGERMNVFGSVGKDNETPVCEMQFDVTLDIGTESFEPVIKDELEEVAVTAHPILNPGAPLIERKWEIETE